VIRKILLVIMLVAASTGAIGVASATPAFAASFSCTPGGANGHNINCVAPLLSQTTLHLSGGGTRTLAKGTTVKVTCYYFGVDATDGYWDHIVWDSQHGTQTGHVNDSQVNFDGDLPFWTPQPNLPQCG
jgi:hypothetical protein